MMGRDVRGMEFYSADNVPQLNLGDGYKIVFTLFKLLAICCDLSLFISRNCKLKREKVHSSLFLLSATWNVNMMGGAQAAVLHLQSGDNILGRAER